MRRLVDTGLELYSLASLVCYPYHALMPSIPSALQPKSPSQLLRAKFLCCNLCCGKVAIANSVRVVELALPGSELVVKVCRIGEDRSWLARFSTMASTSGGLGTTLVCSLVKDMHSGCSICLGGGL